jgi:hypothetical protein
MSSLRVLLLSIKSYREIASARWKQRSYTPTVEINFSKHAKIEVPSNIYFRPSPVATDNKSFVKPHIILCISIIFNYSPNRKSARLVSRVQTRPRTTDFKGDTIRSTPSFGGEVKPSVPCRRFTACKRSLQAWKRCLVRKIKRPCFSPMSLLIRC